MDTSISLPSHFSLKNMPYSQEPHEFRPADTSDHIEHANDTEPKLLA